MALGPEHVVQPAEVMALLVILAAYIPLVMNYRREHNEWVFAAYTALTIGFLATTLEALLFPRFFNLVEHAIGIMVAGTLSFGCAYNSSKLFEQRMETWRED